MRINDMLIGLLVAALGVFVFLAGYRMPALPHLRFGPGFFPELVGFGLVLTGLGLIVRWVFAPETRSPWVEIEPALRTLNAIIGLMLMLGSVVLYIALSEEIGFIPTATAIMSVNLWWFWRRPFAAIFIGLVAALAIQFFFGSFLQVPLPMGVLEPIQGAFSWK
jgi:putative tricarboxylic transport membrane protein